MRLYQKPSGIWAVDFVTPDGERKRVSTGKRDKSEARRLAGSIMAGETPAANDRAPIPDVTASTPLGVTMEGLFRRVENSPQGWRNARAQATIRSNLRIMRELEITMPDGSRALFVGLPVTSVTKRVLQGFVEELEGRDYAPATVKRKLDMVSKALSLAEDWEIIPARPRMPTVKIGDNSRTRVLSQVEEAAVFEAIKAREAAQPSADWRRIGMAIRFLLDTACRKGEMENVTADWIAEINGTHRLTIPAWVAKNGKARTIPLTQAVIDTLPYLYENAGEDGRLFPYRDGFVWYRWRSLTQDLKARKLDLDDVVLHSFRHTCLSRLSERGLPIEKVSIWAGHSDISITAGTYLHLDTSSLDVGAGLLASAI